MEQFRKHKPTHPVYKSADLDSSYEGPTLTPQQVATQVAGGIDIQYPNLAKPELNLRSELLQEIRTHVLNLSAKISFSRQSK